jgi:hypothetical protein
MTTLTAQVIPDDERAKGDADAYVSRPCWATA